MRTSVVAAVWIYMVLAVLAEVAAFYMLGSGYVLVVTMSLAASQAVAITAFYMDLKAEPGPLKFLMILAVLFLSGLIVATIASLG